MSGDVAPAYFEMELPGGSILIFEKLEELVAWVKAETDFWGWLSKIRNENIGLSDNQLSLLSNHLRTALGSLHPSDQKTGPNLGAARDALKQYVNVGLASDGPRAQLIADLRNRFGDFAAMAAVAQFTGSAWGQSQQVPIKKRHEIEVGRSASILFDLGVGERVNDAYNAAAQEMTNAFKSRLEKLSTDGRKEISALIAEREQATIDRNTWTQTSSKSFEEIVARVNTDVNASIDSIQNTEKAFKEQMKLRSSVKYWKDKADEHRKRAHWQKAFLVGYAASVIAGVYWALPPFFEFAKATAIELAEKSTTPLLILTGASILAVSIALWIARMLVRVYLEERHRTIDADERAVMTETYCALTSEGLISEAERVLVLSSLFRPAGESTNKDDGPDTLHHAILAKLLDGKPGKS